MRFLNTEIMGFEAALRGMRNPLNSHKNQDSTFENGDIIIGENDLKLAQNLLKSGSEHCKFMRMIHVQVDLDCPRYLWSELDTYHFGTKNSASTMHKLLNNRSPISFEQFDYDTADKDVMEVVINRLESLRNDYLQVMKDDNISDKNTIMNGLLRRAKKLLPESFLQIRTWDTNYAELRNIYFQRRHHRLPEWNTDFVEWVKTLPYAKELIMYEGEKK